MANKISAISTKLTDIDSSLNKNKNSFGTVMQRMLSQTNIVTL